MSMTMSKHTQGPWEVFLDGDRRHVIRQGTLEYKTCTGSYVQADWIAEIDPDGTGHDDEQTDADAQLIAAAPDLLAACQLALNAFERNDAIDWNILALAIAKALGGEPQ